MPFIQAYFPKAVVPANAGIQCREDGRYAAGSWLSSGRQSSWVGIL